MSKKIKREIVTVLKQGSLQLMVESYSDATRTLQIRGVNDEQIISLDIVTSSDRSLVTSYVDIASVPIFLTARTSGRAVKRGQLYVKVSMLVDGVVVALLMAGYVSETHKPTYPGSDFEGSTDGPGYIRTIVGTNPAVAAEITETVPTGALWQLLSFDVLYTADANAASRTMSLILDDGANEFFRTNVPANVIANFTTRLCWAIVGASVNQGTILYLNVLADNIKLSAGYRIKTLTNNKQVGDDYAAPIFMVEEWIQP